MLAFFLILLVCYAHDFPCVLAVHKFSMVHSVQVGDMEKFHFHPKELVHKLVSIYVNLGQRSEFCHALPQDGRSFSLSLMEEAVEILR